MPEPSNKVYLASQDQDVPLSWDVFRQRGITVSEWARERGFSTDLVYAILRGKRKCVRGASYQIAKELGLK
ncbi:DNA-binding protein [Acidovorax sp. K2F]|uniref:DNA-binding protein n=1 Tax=Acidovorax sp. K2F TaxID=2978125 RepID=UPI0021B0956C|nr:DNA-binding protein [Acidovorax sp. K2F]MCT6721159.1 DNA-binding protein [Acidovorax sp. K2F]